jgi:hypothetical protein
MVNRFNTIRALIVCSSPQVAEEDGYIVTRVRKGNSMWTDDTVAMLATPEAYDIFHRLVIHDPLSVELVHLSVYAWHVIRERGGAQRHLAYMLPS